MRRERIKALKYSTAFAFTILVLYIIQYIGLLPRIGSAAALPLIPLLIFIGSFFGEWHGGIFGIAVGCLMDVTALDPVCFNMLVLFAVGVISGLLVKYYFNRNIFTALLLDVILSFLYFFIKWLVSFSALPSAGSLLFYYSLISALYTAAVGFPLYFFVRWIYMLFEDREGRRT